MIYFIQEERTKAVKIGYAVDVAKRLTTLQIGSVTELRLIKAIPGDMRQEKRLHRRFSEHRIRGEWFRPHTELMEFISSSGVGYEKYGDRVVAILNRRQGEQDCEPCPFCGAAHQHSVGDGHRYAHCNDGVIVVADDGTKLLSDHGYVIRTVA